GYPGDFGALKESLNNFGTGNERLRADVQTMCSASRDGELATRIDPAQHQGLFAELALAVNDSFNNLSAPLRVCTGYMEMISKGEPPQRITDSYLGDYNAIKESINAFVDTMNGLSG